MNTDKDSDNEFADRLTLGSRNIDRMIDNMTQLTRMLIGLIVPILETSLDCFQEIPDNLEFKFKSEDRIVTWMVCFLRCHKRKIPSGPLVPSVQITIYGYTKPGNVLAAFDSSNTHSTSRVEIQHIYERRGVLVKGLLSAFPSLIDDVAHFIAASEVKFPD